MRRGPYNRQRWIYDFFTRIFSYLKCSVTAVWASCKLPVNIDLHMISGASFHPLEFIGLIALPHSHGREYIDLKCKFHNRDPIANISEGRRQSWLILARHAYHG